MVGELDDDYSIEVNVKGLDRVDELRREIQALEKALAAIARGNKIDIDIGTLKNDLKEARTELALLISQMKDLKKSTTDALAPKNIRLETVVNAAQLSSARADKRQVEAKKQLNDLAREHSEAIQEAVDNNEKLTRRMREIGRLTGDVKFKPGTNLEAFEDTIDRIQRLQKKTVDPGFHAKGGGEWVKTFVQQYADTKIKALDAREAWLSKMGFLEPEGRTSRIKPKYAPKDTTLPAYENADYFRGRSKEDTGEVYDTESRRFEELKKSRTTPGATRIPQTRGALDDRMYLMIKGVGTRFKVASQYLQELYVTKDAEFEKVARFLSDQYLGTDTQTGDEKAWIEERFPPLTTQELPADIAGLNPSLLANAPLKPKKQDYKRAHPIHALHMMKRFLAERGYAAEYTMPREAIDKAYQEVTTGKMGKPVVPPADVKYMASKDPNVNAIIKAAEVAEKKQLDGEIEDFVTNHRKWKEVEKKTRAKAIWERLKTIKRAEGTSWTKSRMERMGETIPKGLEPGEMFGRPDIPDRSEYMSNTAEQIAEKYQRLFGGAFSNVNVSGLSNIKTGKQGAVPRMGFRPNKGATLGRFNLTDIMSGKELGVLKFTQDANDLVIKSLESHVQLRGYGKQLLQAAESYAKSIGVKRVVLNSVESAVGFYKKQGYTETGTTPPGQWPEMAKDLTGSTQVPTKSTKVSGTIQGLAMAGAVETAVNQAKQITAQIDEAFANVEPAIDQVTSQAQSMITRVTNINVPMMADTLTSPVTEIGGSIKKIAEEARANVGEVVNVIGNNVLPIGTTVAERMKLQQKAVQEQVRNAYPNEVLPEEIEYKPLEYLVHKFGQTWGGGAGGGREDKRSKRARQSVNDMIMKAVTDMNTAEGELSPDLLMEQWGKIVPITHDLHEIIRKVTSHGEAPRRIGEITDYLKRLNNRYQVSMGKEMLYPEVGVSGKAQEGAIEEPTRLQKMFGQEYKIKLMFTNYEEAEAAVNRLQSLPGRRKTEIASGERYGNLGTMVAHGVTVTGHAPGGPNVGRNIDLIRRETQAVATGPASVPEKASLDIGEKRLSLQLRLEEWGQKLDKLNWKLVRGQMALLGIAFSMQGAIKMVSKAWQTVTTSLSSLEDIFKNIGMAIAFGPSVAQGFLRNMLGSSTKIVDSWKKFTGYQATLNSMLAYFAFKLMQDTRVIFAIDRLVEKLILMLQDTAFMDKIFGLIANIIDALPGIVDSVTAIVTWLMGILELPGMKDALKWMVAFGIAAQFLMTPLAVVGGLIQYLGWVVTALAWALGVDLVAAFAGVSEFFAKGWLANAITGMLGSAAAAIEGLWVALGLAWYDGVTGALVMTTAGTLAAIGAGLVAGLAVVWVMVNSGFTAWLAGAGEMVSRIAPQLMDTLKILLWPFAALGTLIIDVITGQFDHIVPDIEAVMLKALVALASRVQDMLRMIPFGWGDEFVKQLDQFKVNANAVIGNLQVGGAVHIPKAATGGFVAQTGVAVIHKGETITPADELSSQNVQITNYVTATVNNKTDEKYLLEILGRKYYSGAY